MATPFVFVISYVLQFSVCMVVSADSLHSFGLINRRNMSYVVRHEPSETHVLESTVVRLSLRRKTKRVPRPKCKVNWDTPELLDKKKKLQELAVRYRDSVAEVEVECERLHLSATTAIIMSMNIIRGNCSGGHPTEYVMKGVLFYCVDCHARLVLLSST